MSVRSHEREGWSEMLLYVKLTNSWRGIYWCNHWCMAFSWSSWSGGEFEVVDPFRCHQSPAMLSVRDRVVLYRMP